jgi:hypothetical protein
MLAGSRPRGRIGALILGEQALGEPRTPFERPLQALDVQ